MVIYWHENKRRYPIRHRKARLIRGKFLVKARKLGVLVLTFIALAAILRASGVDNPQCDRSAAIIMQCSLLSRTSPDGGMVVLDNSNAQRITDAYTCDVCAGYDKNDPLSGCICAPRAADMLWRNFYAADRKPNMSNRKPNRPKRGIGGKGPKTEFMKRQLSTFKRFLSAANYDGDESRLYSLANQCWLKNTTKWEKAKCATGQNKGYSCPKVLADAHKKSA